MSDTGPVVRPLEVRYEWTVAAAGLVFLGGIYLDGWAHNHGGVDGSFFTPWHAVLYGGYALVTFVVLRPIIARRSLGLSWSEAIPTGYTWTVSGILVFFVGGVGDLLWHTVFGVEEDLEALLSPTHLILATGGSLMAVGPFLASWRRPGSGWAVAGPAIVATFAVWSLVTFMTQFLHPLVELWSTADWRLRGDVDQLGEALGVASILVQSMLLAAVGLFLTTFRRLPFGTLALMITANAAAVVTQGDDGWLVAWMLAAGVISEVGYRKLWPDHPSPGAFRILGGAIPAIVTACYFAGLFVVEEVVWTTHLWAGSIGMAGLVGVLVSVVVAPPAGAGTLD